MSRRRGWSGCDRITNRRGGICGRDESSTRHRRPRSSKARGFWIRCAATVRHSGNCRAVIGLNRQNQQEQQNFKPKLINSKNCFERALLHQIQPGVDVVRHDGYVCRDRAGASATERFHLASVQGVQVQHPAVDPLHQMHAGSVARGVGWVTGEGLACGG